MRFKLSLLTVVVVLALMLSACSSTDDAQPRTLSVNGTGTVYLTPDIAYIYVGVHTENADIAQAVSNNNNQAQAVVGALHGMGVDSTDIQTSNFSVWASQQYDPQTGGYSGTVYMVDNTVYVTVRDLTKLPELLNTVIQAGANNINSISFDVADKTASLAEARQKAMDDASRLAQELAQTAGLKLGEIQTISYYESAPSPYYGYGMGGGGGGGGGAAASINPGQLQLTATVNVTYFIK